MKWSRYAFKKILFITLSLTFIINVRYAGASPTPIQKTVEGNGNYFVTGESFPTGIEFTGYNSRDKKVYLNFDLETTRSVTSTAAFSYYISIYDSASTLLGTLGDTSTPQTVTSTSGASSNKARVAGSAVTLSTPLTAQHRIIVTVDNVTLTP